MNSNHIRLFSVVVASGLTAGALMSPAHAVNKSTPTDMPLITKISSKKYSGGKSSVTVQVKRIRSGMNNYSASKSTYVKVGTKGCYIASTIGSCTVKGLKTGKTYGIQAQMVNKYGKGQETNRRYYKAGGSTKLIHLVRGTSKTAYSRGSVLTTQQVKFSEMKAFHARGTTLRGIQAQTYRNRLLDDPSSVVFDFSDAVALATPESNTNQSGFYKVNAAGEAENPLINGSIVVSNYFIAPNDRVYAILQTKTALVTDGVACLLVSIERESGIPTCVDSTLDNIQQGMGINTNPSVQFDDEGNIYYLGSASGSTILRKSVQGASVDLINGNQSLSDFLVVGNGDVLLAGATQSSGTSWVRKLSAAGSLSTLISGVNATFIKKFADGNIWMGGWGSKGSFVARYIVSSGTMAPKYPFGWSHLGKPVEVALDGLDGPCLNSLSMINQAFCGPSGAQIREYFNIEGTNQTWVVAGWSGSSAQLVRYTPTLLLADTMYSAISIARNVGKTLVLSGVNANDVNILSLYDSATGNQTVIFDGSNEIEIYDMEYVPATGELLFSGLRFSDNRYVVGRVTLS